MNAMDTSLLLTAWITGLLGGTHCVGMCGGISAALSFALPANLRTGPRLFGYQLAYNTGRLLTYGILGTTVGLLGQHIIAPLAGMMWLRLVAGLFMIAMGLYLAGWWSGLARLERIGGGAWRLMEPLRQHLFPVNHPLKAVLVGSAWGFLPCGLVYSALSLSLARSDAMMSGLMMMAFGMGTLPFLLLTGTLAAQVRQILQRPGVRQSAGLAVIAFGLWTAIPFFAAHGHGSQDAHAHHESPHPMPATPAESDDAGADMHHHHH
jgi:sulfite exporter TauE/SafE